MGLLAVPKVPAADTYALNLEELAGQHKWLKKKWADHLQQPQELADLLSAARSFPSICAEATRL